MTRRAVPIYVVPKPGVTVVLDGVVVPPGGIETTVDDELANEMMEGTLDCREAPEHITGTAASSLDGWTSGAVGALAIAGTAGSTGYLSLSGNQPPSTVAATPAFMLSGAGFSFTFTQTSGSTTAQQVLLSFNTDLNDSIQVRVGGGIYVRAGGAVIVNAPGSWSLAQPVTVAVRPSAGTLTVSGATTGDGTVSVAGGAWTWPAGVLGVGRMSHTATLEFTGTLSDVVGEGGGSLLAGLVSSAVGSTSDNPEPDPGAGFALLVNASGAFLINAAGDYLYGKA